MLALALAALLVPLPAGAESHGTFWAATNGPQGGDGIAMATNASGHVFVGTQGGGVFRSTNNGDT